MLPLTSGGQKVSCCGPPMLTSNTRGGVARVSLAEKLPEREDESELERRIRCNLRLRD
jgi:hypothetical protein